MRTPKEQWERGTKGQSYPMSSDLRIFAMHRVGVFGPKVLLLEMVVVVVVIVVRMVISEVAHVAAAHSLHRFKFPWALSITGIESAVSVIGSRVIAVADGHAKCRNDREKAGQLHCKDLAKSV